MKVKDVVLTVGVRGVLVISGLATTLITSRLLGPTGRGEYFFVTAFVAVASQMVHLGLHASNAYYAARNPNNFSSLAVNSYWLSITLGTAAALIGILGFAIRTPAVLQSGGVYWSLLLAPATLATLYVSNLYVGANRIVEFNVIQLASVFLPLLAICGAAPFFQTSSAFLAAAALAGVVNHVVLSTYTLRHARDLTFDRKIFREGIQFALKAYVVNALGALALKGPALMFASNSSTRELGFFSVASQVFDTLSILPASVAAIAFPALMKLGPERWRETRRLTALLMGMTALACLVLAAFAEPIVRILFGPRFGGAVRPLLFVLPAAIFASGTSVLSQFLATHGMPWSTALAWGTAAVCCFGVAPFLIRDHGAIGASVALSLATCIAWITLLALSFREHSVATKSRPT